MTTKWSYSGNPQDSQRDAVRFLISDTDPKDPLLTDAEIDYLIEQEGSTNEAAVAGSQAALGRLQKLVSTSTDKIKTEYQQRFDHMVTIVAHLKSKRTKRPLNVYAGGLSMGDKASQEQDTDRVKPAFTRELHDEQQMDYYDDEDCL